MAKQTVLQEVQERMKTMQENKAKDLDTISKKQQEARTQIEAAELAMKQATKELNVDNYEAAKNQKRKAQTALDMYNGRYNQIKQQEYISEADSDKVVDSLLAYENQLEADFKAAVAEHLKKLADLYKEYNAAVVDTENTIKKWERNIHANYSTRGRTTYKNETTGEWTDRSPRPIPVHRLPYTGCSEALQLGLYLKTASKLYAED